MHMAWNRDSESVSQLLLEALERDELVSVRKGIRYWIDDAGQNLNQGA
jgi:hypothetical protein